MTLRRWLRELFRGRETRYGVRYFRGQYEKLDFVSRDSAEDWMRANFPGVEFVAFSYVPVDLVFDRNRVRRSEHPTPQ